MTVVWTKFQQSLVVVRTSTEASLLEQQSGSMSLCKLRGTQHISSHFKPMHQLVDVLQKCDRFMRKQW